MLSKLRKLSKDIILYSVLVADYERLDFKNDALAGVRANFFNAKCAPQSEKTDITIDGKTHYLAYTLKKKEPLSWKISYANQPVQTVKRSVDGSYCVLSYGDNGIVFKRQYFDSGHLWLRTEYYHRRLENSIAAVVYPRMAEGLLVLRLQRFSQSGITSQDLYPSLKMPKKPCAALIYSNSGMIWYDASFKPSDFDEDDGEQPEGGFHFTREAFISGTSRDLLDLRKAPYLGEEDISVAEAEPEPEPEAQEPVPYSAYDRIESILFEAHKTNKSIFGELANEPMKDDEPEQADSPVTKEYPAEDEASGLDDTPVTKEYASDGEAPAEETAAEQELSADSDDAVAVKAETEPEPDSLIPTKNGSYSYYGALDEQQHRTGRGRTVTPEGLTAYDGEYSDDKRHGFGVCYYKDGSPNYIGDWERGDRSGRGVGFRRSDGTLHVGKWNENKPDGFGARFDKDGNFLDVCTYVGGARNGKSVSFDEDGNVVVRLWKDGELMSEKILSD